MLCYFERVINLVLSISLARPLDVVFVEPRSLKNSHTSNLA